MSTFIESFAVRYSPATNTRAAHFTVKRLDSFTRGKTVAYNYSVALPMVQAIHDTFGVDPAHITYVGRLSATTNIYIQQQP
jgi:hypothetical protein